MEFMPQENDVSPPSNAIAPISGSGGVHLVEEEMAAVRIGGDTTVNPNNQTLPQFVPPQVAQGAQPLSVPVQQQQLIQPPLPSQQPAQQEQPIYFSDGVMYASELAQAQSQQNNGQSTSTDQTVAIPDDLIQVYNNLGLFGKLLTGGTIVTIRFLQAFRTLGENIVDVLGITRPKYEYELNLARELQQQEEARKQKMDQLYAPWQGKPAQGTTAGPLAAAPSSSSSQPTVLDMDGGGSGGGAPQVPSNLQSTPMFQNVPGSSPLAPPPMHYSYQSPPVPSSPPTMSLQQQQQQSPSDFQRQTSPPMHAMQQMPPPSPGVSPFAGQAPPVELHSQNPPSAIANQQSELIPPPPFGGIPPQPQQ